jgi:CheY-like chemotaxis protein
MPAMDGFEVVQRIRERGESACTTILMLSSEEQAADAARCRMLGVNTFLVKPLTRRELLAAILGALDAGAVRTDRVASGRVAAVESTGGLHLLLAEDNIINQTLAAGLLKRAGHDVTIVGDGQAAVAAAAAQCFDAILMDVQMPTMSGFEATAAIRTSEQAAGRRTRIIAMTAHAMQGDRDRCLAAGMDDYISKPIRPGDLLRALAAVPVG